MHTLARGRGIQTHDFAITFALFVFALAFWVEAFALFVITALFHKI